MAATDPDAALMLAFRAGDERAFEALVERFGKPVVRYLTRMVRDGATAEDLAQEAFLRVHRARHRYAPEARFSTWLYTIATRLALNELRRRAHSGRGADGGAGGVLAEADPAPGADAVTDARRRLGSVERALAALPERQRAALWLVAVEGLAYEDVAASLETSVASVKSLVHRARSALAGAGAERSAR